MATHHGGRSAEASWGALESLDPRMFPDANPNPVLSVADDGRLRYANPASSPICRTLALEVGTPVPAGFLDQLRSGARSDPPEPFELECELRTFAMLPVRAADGNFYVYGTDVTGTKVVERFPGRNPNPVLRVNPEGRVLYANEGAARITRSLGVAVGDLLSPELHTEIRQALEADPGARRRVEVAGEGRIYELAPVLIPEFGFINLYGTDVTALRAINKFPDENPNPVMRADRDGTLTYANPASAAILAALGARVGDRLPPETLERVRAILDGRAPNMLEVAHADRVYEVRAVSLFEFDSINFYGTDVTASRQVEQAHRENERLLLNILPSSIADRLRQGEAVIADAFEEMAVLFADVVDFTPYSALHQADEVVSVLNRIFTRFDGLVDRHRLEKIKTVGDAYMAVGGLQPDGGGPAEVAEMALDILDEMRAFRPEEDVEMQIRVGLHVGPGIGGVIGLKKFIYDVWGDTVNIASRLEANGVPGRIQVTADTVARLDGAYRFERRGTVEIKGKGPTETFFLVGRRG